MLSIMKKHPLERRKLQLGKKTIIKLTGAMVNAMQTGKTLSQACPASKNADDSCELNPQCGTKNMSKAIDQCTKRVTIFTC
jgi:hypothetical protein